jgi:hypothetical protein
MLNTACRATLAMFCKIFCTFQLARSCGCANRNYVAIINLKNVTIPSDIATDRQTVCEKKTGAKVEVINKVSLKIQVLRGVTL